ncbi:RelA/SpoT family protein [Orrella daihaiensis]|uniref:GTP pyrophosphokinase n=1 Tax=Orrella daihaiensis TaxID=2782176 RepID=A0ABY4AH43_9BURK|nr:bifunctional (p)ppGpp synthetase/guanosine-3',5'-bis(diphosphate) 3'-pyrophosphohydrolase [Orrella daihaiensis]UOD49607.1 bifunctional (p)ppGpp synthetase/guanosine-3',5'-bis(diphosphate) 3'-pyrophosphohydrolase [Orrella daihaiensis]
MNSHFNTVTDEQVDQVSTGLTSEDRARLLDALHWAQQRSEPAVIVGSQPLWEHCLATAEILASLQSDVASRIAAILLALPAHDGKGLDPISKTFGPEIGKLVQGTRALLKLGEVAREATGGEVADLATQKENLRKMLLAMAADLRIVLIRLASRLQTLRWHAKTKQPCGVEFAQETLDLYAPLANRLGIWQVKWEMEDLAFRFQQPEKYKEIAKALEEKRIERESFIDQTLADLKALLEDAGIEASVSGRPKHIFSIWNKMNRKAVDISRLYDLRAVRVIVADERSCYNVLGIVHEHWSPIGEEFDDYISRPKSNGYRSLHTVVADKAGRAFEVQIRTQAMHDFAEHGMAAHWRYKETGKSSAPAAGAEDYDRQLAWMRQLLAWQTEAGSSALDQQQPQTASDRIYVLSPQARVIELPRGATPIDFAYHLHTDLGHRCRGARVDGQMVPLQTKLDTGQTVDIITTKAGGPSRDWLNPQLGYLASPRAKAKVRAWFNAIELQQRITQGHALVEKELQRLGKTAINQEQLAQQLGFAHADDLYVAVAKEDFSLRHIDAVFQPKSQDEQTRTQPIISEHKPASSSPSGVLVQGVDSLLTQLARCCRPAPPDPISGFVTRGRGVSIHRSDCPSFVQLARRDPERVIEVSWGQTGDSVYPVDVVVHAHDRHGLLRDLSEVFARLRLNVVGVNTQSKASLAHMVFTVQVSGADVLQRALAALTEVSGVLSAQRR